MRPRRSAIRLLAWPAVVWRQIKRAVPTSLFGRSLLIIILPVALMQSAVTYVFFEAHWQGVNARLTDGLAGDVAWIVRDFEADPSAANLDRLAQRAERTMDLSVTLQDRPDLPRGSRRSLFPTLDHTLGRALAEHLDAPFWFDSARYPAYVDVRVRTPSGVLRIIAPKDRVFATRGHVFLMWLAIATLALTAIAIAFIRNQIRAIEDLAEAAEAFGKGEDAPLRPHGAREVRQAARTFLAMRARIQRHVEQRTILLASVSHDLRTPLTRLKLELTLSPPGARITAMKSDVDDMERMVAEYLAFARDEEGEKIEDVDLAALVADLAHGVARGGRRIAGQVPPGLTVRGRATALKRALANLVANATEHADEVSIAAFATPGGGVEIQVDDDGPGIPERQREQALRPFTRGVAAQAEGDGGVGLGLAIARDVARSHGGDIRLAASPRGGLRAVLQIPG